MGGRQKIGAVPLGDGDKLSFSVAWEKSAQR